MNSLELIIWRRIAGVSFLLSVALFAPFMATATSGACSYHGGVDCSAGSGIYGQVICNDGWDGSSVSYYSMVECQSSPPSGLSCPQPIITGCTEQFEYTQWQSLCTQQQQLAQTYCAQQRSFLGAYGGNTSAPCNAPPPSTDYCAKASLCESQINAYNASKQSFDQCVSAQMQQSAQASNALSNSICQNQYGLNSSYDQSSRKCVCNQGYLFDSVSSQCEVASTACTDTLGTNGYAKRVTIGLTTQNQCACHDGFAVGASGKCIDVRPVRLITQQALDWAKSGQSCRSDSSLSADEMQQCAVYESNPDSIQWQISTSQVSTPVSTGGNEPYQGMDAAPVPPPAPAVSSRGSGALSGFTIGSTHKRKNSALAALLADTTSTSTPIIVGARTATSSQKQDRTFFNRFYQFISLFFKAL